MHKKICKIFECVYHWSIEALLFFADDQSLVVLNIWINSIYTTNMCVGNASRFSCSFFSYSTWEHTVACAHKCLSPALNRHFNPRSFPFFSIFNESEFAPLLVCCACTCTREKNKQSAWFLTKMVKNSIAKQFMCTNVRSPRASRADWSSSY